MKLLTALGLLAIAFAAWPPHERSFSSGNTYEFEWKGQIVSGVPVKGSSSHSIQQIRTKVFLTFNDKHSYIRLAEFRITNGHKQLTEPRSISEGSFEVSEISREQQEQINLPVRFRYNQGIVSEIVFSEEESAWSENIKRSVLNMIQVQLTPRKSQDEYNKEKYDIESKNKFFTLPERTLEGECEVVYTIVEGEKSRDEMEVTKSINFNKCSKRVDIRYGPRYSAECPMCEEADARPESQTVISYKLRGNEQSFLITDVELKSEYVYTPFSKDQEMLSTYVHQKMRLVKVSSAERVSEPRNGKRSSLLYNYEMELARENFWMNGNEESYKLTGYEGIPKKELMEKYVRMVISSMEENTKDGVTLETNHNFARMVEIYRMCTEREIQEIHRHFWESSQYTPEINLKIRHFLIDALIAAGTKNTVQHFVDKCEKGQIAPVRASVAVKGLVNMRVPSEKIVNMLLSLAKSRVGREEPVLRQSILLTCGALMNGVCTRNVDSWAIEIEGQKECTREMKNQWVKEWESLFKSSNTRYEKILVLKSLANSALDLSVHFLEKIIYDRTEALIVRQSAIDALRLLRDQMPRKVQSVTLPLFKSRREPVALRISALYQLIHSRPERALLDQIVHRLNVEPSVQLRSFGVSLLRSLAESKKNPCEIKLAKDINVSLRMLRSSPMSGSAHIHLPWYSRVFDFGLTMDFASIFSNESVLPNELLASVDKLYGGQWNKHLFQLGFSQNNMDNVILPLIEKLEKTESKTLIRGMRNQAPLREVLKEILRQMKVQSRDAGFENEQAFGMLYLRYKNLDYAILPAEQDLLEKMFREYTTYTTTEVVRQLTRGVRVEGVLSGFVYEHLRIIPTSMGLPLQVNTKMPTVGALKAFVKAELSPKINLRIDMEPSLVSTHVTSMTVLSPDMHIGSRVFHSVQITLPINCKIEYNYEEKTLKTTMSLPKEEKRVMLLESRPITFIRSFNSKHVPKLEEKTIRIPLFEKTSVHYEKTYGKRVFGLPIEILGNVHRRVFEKPESILFGENHVQISLIPSEESTKEIIVEMIPSYKMENNDFESPRYDEIFTEQEFGLETSDESDERPEERTARRGHSKKFYQSLKSLKGVEGSLMIRAYTTGGPRPLNGDMTIKGSCEESLQVCRFEVEGKRSPLFEKESREWKMRVNGEIVLPESPKTLKELQQMGHKEIEATLKCSWGAEEKNEMNVRIQKTQSSEMARLVKYADFETKQGLEQYDMLRHASKLNKLNILVDKELSRDNEQYFRRLFDILKAYYFIGGSVEPIRSDGSRIKVEVTVEPEDCRRVNFTIENNGEKLIVKEAYSPIRIPLYSIGSRRSSFKGVNKNSWTSVFMPSSECKVSSNKVNTFDGLVYKTPITTCYSILATDCSSNPEYAIMMKKVSHKGEEKKLRIVTKSSEIECELQGEKLTFKVDKRSIEDEEELSRMGIEMSNKKSCEITIRSLIVRFDGYKVEIEADKRTENTQCGLCGHFDGRRDNEFRRADNEETEDIEEFHRSWLLSDSECKVEESRIKNKENYGIDSDEERYDSRESLWVPYNSDEEESWGESRSRKMLKKSLKKHLNRNNIQDEEESTYKPEKKYMNMEYDGKTCFTLEEQPMCQPEDEIMETETKKIQIACLPRSDRMARSLLNALKRGEEMREKLGSLKTHSYSLEVPTLCRVY